MLAIILLTIGALNAAAAMTLETCTQGGADSLRGGFLTLFLYLGGIASLVSNPLSPKAFVGLVPAIAIAVWHSIFAVRFMQGYLAYEMSACYAIEGGFSPEKGGDWMDGSEPMLIILWMSISIIFWVGVAYGFKRSVSAARD